MRIRRNANSDSTTRFRAVMCKKITTTGLRIETGISKYFYNEKTQQWLGNHGGPNLNFILTVNKLNFGLRFKPWTVNPTKELVFNSDTLTKLASLNPVKVDYFVGYSIDLNHNISIEPYIGISNSTFHVINEVELKKSFTIPSINGLISGITFNKYFKIKEGEYIAVFANAGYSFTDFKKVHESLEMGYIDCTLGVAYKGFFVKQFLKKVE
jgi:hypothetical protein